MRQELKSASALVFFAIFLIAGCAAPTRAIPTNHSETAEAAAWRGRLAVRVEADPAQSFAAGFELAGTPLAGELTLYTPLGNTATALSWSAQTATLRSNGDVRSFESLNALIKQALGTEIPVAALFAWLAGDNMTAAGWRADLSRHGEGRITARRSDPAPAAELRLVLEK